MENSGTTSISQLPTNMMSNSHEQPLQNQANNNNNNNNNNIILNKNEIISETTGQMPNPIMQQITSKSYTENQNANQNNYNEMINQLQKATLAGATGLPSRDIPINTTAVNNDTQIKPNFIPEPQNSNYIKNTLTPEDLIGENTKKQHYLDSLDKFYNEFQLPLLVCVLYFLFQLPIFRKTLKKFLPSLFGKDGNHNLYGYFFNSVLFAISFYILVKLINQITLSIF